ncbi:enoyl-CoA hydratase-related protein [Rhodococcus artemisiae]|uniref:Enoyl-CoA hydratase-related protein n=1 Tax=Rhodococcus artemisiae TaxID=714159 RepID=A0ABU7L6N3_9NOCA|nr:enoyl-CoA hydratase-related protein [Rhodococcus artemisiae]MEE2057200.1 enoyl-CoA hydratase-related protein [Rhodococcus artemisiae]
MRRIRDSNKRVLVEQIDQILVVTINRPHARNAVSAAVTQGLVDALARAQNDPDIRAVVVTGAGDEAFCGGGDLKEMAAGRSLYPSPEIERAWGFGGFCRHPIDKPIIAAVNGYAIGGGVEIAMACDLVVATESAWFSLPEVRNGFLASGGGAIRAAQWLPRAIAMEILLLGERFSARQAHEWGLVNRVVPDGRSLSTALDLAYRIATSAPLAVQATKRLVAGIVDGTAVTEVEAWARNDREDAVVSEAEDAKEGPRAFAEKRPAVWKGR